MPYLDAAEYVATFGETETKRITSEDGVAIDTTKVENAITFATDLANGYIAAKYDLPLASTPPGLIPVIADLARERLFPQSPPQAVKDKADLARAWLKDVSLGRVKLPVDTGGTAPTIRTGSTVRTSGDARCPVFNDCSLGGFVGFGSGTC